MARRGDFQAFKENLSFLAFLDKWNAFHTMKCVQTDLQNIFAIESLTTMHDYESVMAKGHGIPLLHSGKWGPSLVYWTTPISRRATQWSIIGETDLAHNASAFPIEGVCLAFLGMEEYPGRTTTFLPDSKSQYLVPGNDAAFALPPSEASQYRLVHGTSINDHPLAFYDPVQSTEGGIAVPVLFCLKLSPPIAATAAVGKAIAALVGIEGATDPMIEHESAAGDLVYASMEELLTRSATARKGIPLTSLKFKSKFEDQVQSYVFSADSDVPAIVIQKIPIAHPAQILPVLNFAHSYPTPKHHQILRKHLAFNALFRSCFNPFTLAIAESER
ncbi:hypothetical protein BDK51DRAFT_28007, partial [Blyttiomyces helicus]